MNCIILMSEWCNKKLQLPAGLFLSHFTLINISQPARMVCYRNLMNFCTEWNASNWQSVIKQNRREYKSPENREERTNKRAEREGEKKKKPRGTLSMVGLECIGKSPKSLQHGRLLAVVLDQWCQCCFSFIVDTNSRPNRGKCLLKNSP